ncbi:acyltransferase family protein [Demequina maris]|uniref:acyltransferase family protein n=1 Tax=Demequina maris TaxID=1638982 RepID=UPI0007861B19|nr:acyltransferase [Demequina maris]
MGGRDKVVDSLRGIACILLVTLHVAQNRWGEADWLEWYGDTFIYIRMPLFAFLSGVVYAWRPLTDVSHYGTYLGKKVRRLLIPYAIFVPLIGLTQVLLDYGTPPPSAIYDWFLYSLPPYWFLLATFWVYAVVALMDTYKLLDTKLKMGVLFGLLLAVNIIFNMQDATGFLQFTSAVYLGLFFVAGMAATRFGWKNIGLTGAWIMTGATVALFIYTQFAVNGVWAAADNQRQDPLGIALGIAFPLAFIAFGRSNNFLAWVGGYSYGIFLLHPFAVAATAGALKIVGFQALAPSLVIMSITGLFGSILGVIVLRKVAVGRIMLGERGRKPAPKPVEAKAAEAA